MTWQIFCSSNLSQLPDLVWISVVGLNGEQVKSLVLGLPGKQLSNFLAVLIPLPKCFLGTAVSLGLRRMNGKMFYVRVPRAQPKKSAAAQQPPPPAQPQRAPAQAIAAKPQAINAAKLPLRPSGDGSPKSGSDQVPL